MLPCRPSMTVSTEKDSISWISDMSQRHQINLARDTVVFHAAYFALRHLSLAEKP